jgi:hypothetical protein
MDVRTVLRSGIDHSPTPKIGSAGQPFLYQEVQGPIDCGNINGTAPHLHVLEYLLDSHVPPTVGDDLNNHLPLWGDPISTLTQGFDKRLTVRHMPILIANICNSEYYTQGGGGCQGEVHSDEELDEFIKSRYG